MFFWIGAWIIALLLVHENPEIKMNQKIAENEKSRHGNQQEEVRALPKVTLT